MVVRSLLTLDNSFEEMLLSILIYVTQKCKKICVQATSECTCTFFSKILTELMGIYDKLLNKVIQGCGYHFQIN